MAVLPSHGLYVLFYMLIPKTGCLKIWLENRCLYLSS